jgi:hypothetical protein
MRTFDVIKPDKGNIELFFCSIFQNNIEEKELYFNSKIQNHVFGENIFYRMDQFNREGGGNELQATILTPRYSFKLPELK